MTGFPVVIVDDHELFSTSLTLALRDLGIDARWIATTQLCGLAGPPVGGPALAVLDLDLGEDAHGRPVRGEDWVVPLIDRGWTVLIVTGAEDEQACATAISAGAVGLVRKSDPFQELLSAVRDAAVGNPVMSEPERARWVARHEARARRDGELAARLASLTEGEHEVLELLADGEHAAEIARRLAVSLATVRTRIGLILAKLGVASQLEAAALFRPPPG